MKYPEHGKYYRHFGLKTNKVYADLEMDKNRF